MQEIRFSDQFILTTPLFDNSFLTGGSNAVFWDLVTYGNGIEILGLSLEAKQNVLNDPDVFKKATETGTES